MQNGEDDEDINTIDTSMAAPPPLGPMTRARARQLNHQVSSFLSSCPLGLYNGDVGALERWRGSKGRKAREGWIRIRTAGRCQLVTVAATSYRLGLGCFSTSRKAYQVYFQTDPAPHPYLFRVGRHCVLYTESFSVTVLRHPILAHWAMYQVESIKDTS
ncbi:hypothetical protein U9M48_007605 [Paspalum notatum var. saurae]|uniref:Uncharacterized protein n=1 Tax=Paspalum notatum var. saurae TaxID=547442 RepID=A0AAQ3WBS5_PASNO